MPIENSVVRRRLSAASRGDIGWFRTASRYAIQIPPRRSQTSGCACQAGIGQLENTWKISSTIRNSVMAPARPITKNRA